MGVIAVPVQVQQLLSSLQTKFKSLSERVAANVDAHGERLEELEQQIAELVHQAKLSDKS
jgi:hypothetical protein